MRQKSAYFSGGCFWCTEAFFEKVAGVHEVVSGYAGGGVEDRPTYFAHGDHAETVRVQFNPDAISYWDLLRVFWLSHDPTTLNRDGANVGRGYRSLILYANEEQKCIAEASKHTVASSLYADTIVTEVVPFDIFHQAEAYHQSYYELNNEAPYCQVVIAPKLEKRRHWLLRLAEKPSSLEAAVDRQLVDISNDYDTISITEAALLLQQDKGLIAAAVERLLLHEKFLSNGPSISD